MHTRPYGANKNSQKQKKKKKTFSVDLLHIHRLYKIVALYSIKQ